MTTNSDGWRSVENDLPGWRDTGYAELRASDGSILRGEMMIEEQWTGEEEIPFAVFTTSAGVEVSIFDFAEWRIVRPFFTAWPS
jgi:hypothetical protein